MLNANQLFGEAVKQVYEPDWSGREKFVKLLDVSPYIYERTKNMEIRLNSEVSMKWLKPVKWKLVSTSLLKNNFYLIAIW